MFCPKCATQNVDGASYCRSCGANISLVPQALTGQLAPASPPDDDCYRGRRRRGEPSKDYAIRSLMLGIAFAVMIAMTSKFVPGSSRWWFWLLIPTMIFFGRGFAELARLHGARKQAAPVPQTRLNSVRGFDLPSQKTGELATAVPSVTEGTTRHLVNDLRTRQLDSVEDQRRS